MILIRRGRIIGKNRDATVWAVMLTFFLTWFATAFETMLKGTRFIPVLFTAGTVLLGFSSSLRIRTLWELKSTFTTVVEKNKGQKIVMSGPYARIRHPLYLATLIIGLSGPIALAALLSTLLLPLTLAGVLIRIRKEEEFMTRHFPDYPACCRRTKRLLPGLY